MAYATDYRQMLAVIRADLAEAEAECERACVKAARTAAVDRLVNEHLDRFAALFDEELARIGGLRRGGGVSADGDFAELPAFHSCGSVIESNGIIARCVKCGIVPMYDVADAAYRESRGEAPKMIDFDG